MKAEDVFNFYEKKKKQYGKNTYKYISQIFKEIQELHQKSALEMGKDVGQSWRSFKGKNLELLIEYIITDGVHHLGLEIISGNKLERSSNLPEPLAKVKRNLCIDYGEFGMHLPDVDMVIYEPETSKVIAVLSCKVTLRERIAQTGYWKLKLHAEEITKHIKVFFITPDEDKTLTDQGRHKKGRAICETDTDGCYLLSDNVPESSHKIKRFAQFIDDLNNVKILMRSQNTQKVESGRKMLQTMLEKAKTENLNDTNFIAFLNEALEVFEKHGIGDFFELKKC